MAWFELAGRAVDGTEIALGVEADSAEDAMSFYPEIQEIFWITHVSDDGIVLAEEEFRSFDSPIGS